jgi:Tfp pilus assembly protein PilF|tara:strand:+ start:1186 stop:1959 length:774 start_codon:yes stop_codon:yes gene_type:complete
MKKYLFTILTISLFITSCNQAPSGDYIEWLGDNEAANELTLNGMNHYLNFEQEMAYTYFKAALDLDPSLFAPHVMLAWMTPSGEEDSKHVRQAKELVKGKNENSQLFVEMLDVPANENRKVKLHEYWSKMHKIEPDGNFIHYYYALTKPTDEERIAELEAIVEKLKSENKRYEYALNNLAYDYYLSGNKEKGKEYFDQYVQAYPNGYNSHDSMAEYYYMEKDYKNSLNHYKRARELYPQSVSANNKIKEINALLDKK